MKNIYKHTKTGKLYELVQERILFKDVYDEEYDYDSEGRPTMLLKREFSWRGKTHTTFPEHLVLYKALYENPDGPYFVRHSDDFYNNFEKVEMCKYTKQECKFDNWSDICNSCLQITKEEIEKQKNENRL